jgi:MFS family permease
MAAGFGMMSQTTISNTIIQTTVHPSMRGRVISYYAMAFMGMMPIGGLLVGAVSQYVGAPDTILVEGILALIIAMVFSHSLIRKKTKKKVVV